MLVRNDLKQYTAEAFTALVTLTLVSRLEREWSRKRLAALSVSVWAGMLVSNAVAFVGVAAFAAVCIVQITRRAWRRLAEAVVAGAATGVRIRAGSACGAKTHAPSMPSAFTGSSRVPRVPRAASRPSRPHPRIPAGRPLAGVT